MFFFNPNILITVPGVIYDPLQLLYCDCHCSLSSPSTLPVQCQASSCLWISYMLFSLPENDFNWGRGSAFFFQGYLNYHVSPYKYSVLHRSQTSAMCHTALQCPIRGVGSWSVKSLPTMSHSPANPLVNCSVRTFTQLLQVQVRWGCPKREALPLLEGNGEGWAMGKKERAFILMLTFFPLREICLIVLGKVCSVIALEIGPASLDKHTLNSSWSTSAAHSPTENPASDPLPEKNHCYSLAFYSWTSGHGQPDVPRGEMKSWNMMLLLGLLAREENKKVQG